MVHTACSPKGGLACKSGEQVTSGEPFCPPKPSPAGPLPGWGECQEAGGWLEQAGHCALSHEVKALRVMLRLVPPPLSPSFEL